MPPAGPEARRLGRLLRREAQALGTRSRGARRFCSVLSMAWGVSGPALRIWTREPISGSVGHASQTPAAAQNLFWGLDRAEAGRVGWTLAARLCGTWDLGTERALLESRVSVPLAGGARIYPPMGLFVVRAGWQESFPFPRGPFPLPSRPRGFISPPGFPFRALTGYPLCPLLPRRLWGRLPAGRFPAGIPRRLPEGVPGARPGPARDPAALAAGPAGGSAGSWALEALSRDRHGDDHHQGRQVKGTLARTAPALASPHLLVGWEEGPARAVGSLVSSFCRQGPG